MITPQSFSLEWINAVSRQYKADRILVEKTIHALSLLEGLAESSVSFVFKGGTAMMLMMQASHRLSIDIDITVAPQNSDLQGVLQNIAKNKGFLRYEEQQRTPISNIPKKHFKFFYSSTVENKESHILLDVLFETTPYSNLVAIPIANRFLQMEGADCQVYVPDVNNLLADKLTAFAPRTIGIPYSKNGTECGMEIIKQLYDIGHLFDRADDVTSIANTYCRIARQELTYRAGNFTLDDVFHDTIDNALSICFRCDYNGTEFSILQKGIKDLISHIYSESFHIEKAILSAAKIAYLASLIQNQFQSFEKFNSKHLTIIKDWVFLQYEYTKLNKLKKTNPEAFFYLYKALNNL